VPRGDSGNRTSAAKQLPPPSGRKLALLIGCTKYDKLVEKFQLKGPANDVILMRDTLKERFGFKDADIITLAEGAGAAGRPTRANIKKEFDRLAQVAQPGDQIVILMGGHGSQQPDQPPYDEEDGLDETFLPCDAGPWDGGKEEVTNAIIDDELAVWTKAITDRRAYLWMVVDACHSGTMLRGGGADEVAREIPANELIPEAVLEKARKDANLRKLPPGAEDAPFSGTGPYLVGLYAAQPFEPTVERPMPPERGTTRYGLLTYTLCQILKRADAPLTYRDLCQRIHTQYVQWGRTSPTPLTEGPGLENEVLGTRIWPGRKFVLAREGEEEGNWKIKAGLLDGLTEGSILAVYPPAGQADKVLGHVRIQKCQATEAEVKACAHAKVSQQNELPLGGRCVPVFVDFGDLRLRVALDEDAKKSPDGPRLRKELQAAGKAPDSPVTVTDAPRKADIFARLKKGRAYLVPSDVLQMPGKWPPGAPHFGPYPLDPPDKLHKALARIARARNLLRLASGGPGQDTGALGLEVTLLKTKGKEDRKGEKLTWQKGGVQLTAGNWVAWKLVNRSKSREAVYFTLLFIDSNYGIRPVFPHPGTVGDNLLKAGETRVIGPIRVNADTVGLEHVAVIAVRAEGEPIDFTCLAQPTLERAAGDAARRGSGGKQAMDSPLGRVLQKALYAQGTARGLDTGDVDTSELRLISWQVRPEGEKK
jgi:hypothetical protein